MKVVDIIKDVKYGGVIFRKGMRRRMADQVADALIRQGAGQEVAPPKPMQKDLELKTTAIRPTYRTVKVDRTPDPEISGED